MSARRATRSQVLLYVVAFDDATPGFGAALAR
jgi:hypothetical protein